MRYCSVPGRFLFYQRCGPPASCAQEQAPLFRLGFGLLLALFVGTWSTAQEKGNTESTQTHASNKGEKIMTGDELTGELRRLDPNNRMNLDHLARAVIEQSRSPIRAVLDLAGSSDQALSKKARSLLSNVDDLAIVPLLDAPEPSDPFVRIWQLNTVMSAQLELRDKVVAKLDSMLADKTPIPWRTIKHAEVAPRSSRVCDEAYLMMRRLLNTTEGKNQFVYDRKAFLALSEKERDTEILKSKKSRTWTNLVGREE